MEKLQWLKMDSSTVTETIYILSLSSTKTAKSS